jgi:hypothetical protein
LPETGSAKPNQMFAMASRYMVMEPASSENLEQFLTSYQRFGAYFLLPAFMDGAAQPKFAFDLAILKRKFTAKLAADVFENDIENVTMRD